jgi:hypothetical protein
VLFQRRRMHIADEIIIHVGLAKTGTTALQEACLASKQELLAAGALYPCNEANHFHFQSMFADEPHALIQVARLGLEDKEAENRHIDAYRTLFEREVSVLRPQRILISSEYFTSMQPHEMLRLASYLRRFAKKLRVLVYLRDPWSFTVSIGQEEIRTGRWSGRLRWDYRGDMTPYLDAFEHGFGVTAEVRIYDGDTVNEFAQWTGLPIRSSGAITNQGMGYKTACMLTLLNKQYPQFIGDKYMPDEVRDWMIDAIARAFPNDQPIRLSRYTAGLIREHAESDLRSIEARYFGGERVFDRFYEQGDFINDEDMIDVSRLGPAIVSEGLMRAMRFLSEQGIHFYKMAQTSPPAASPATNLEAEAWDGEGNQPPASIDVRGLSGHAAHK